MVVEESRFKAMKLDVEIVAYSDEMRFRFPASSAVGEITLISVFNGGLTYFFSYPSGAATVGGDVDDEEFFHYLGLGVGSTYNLSSDTSSNICCISLSSLSNTLTTFCLMSLAGWPATSEYFGTVAV